MRIALVNYGHLPCQQTPEQVLGDFHSLTGWAEALADEGAKVEVYQGFSRDAEIERGGIPYHFVEGPFAPRLSRWRIPRPLQERIADSAPDVVHLQGLLYALQAGDLARRLPARCRLVLQHHAERAPGAWVSRLQRRALILVTRRSCVLVGLR